MISLAVMLLTAIGSRAQVKLGVQGGLDLTKMSFNSSIFESSNRLGFFMGPTVKFKVPIVGLSADLSALYNQQSAEFAGSTVKRKYINVPLNVRAGLDLGESFSLFALAGPQVGFNIGDESFSLGDSKSYKSTFQMRKSLFSVNLGAGFLLNHIQVTAKYNIPMGRTGDITISDVIDQTKDNLKAGSNDVKAKNSWQLGLTYFF